MLDRYVRPVIDPLLERSAGPLQGLGLSANSVTVGGFVLGVLAMAAIATGHELAGLVLLLANRVADGLDGAVARIAGITDLGGYLDITLDFIVYSGLVFAFALADPERNALAASFLIFSFVGTGCSFLAFAIMAAKRRLASDLRGKKSLYYLGGLTEGTETIALFVLLCLAPGLFPPVAWIFGALCWITTCARIATAVIILRSSD